jgi:hypothetical protein
LIEIGLLVLEKKIFENFQGIFTLLLLSPLGQGHSLSFEQFRIPPIRIICAKSDQNWPCGSGEEVENVKVYKHADGRRTTRDQKSSLELSAQVS